MYNLLENYKAKSYSQGRGGAKIEYIVIHHWGSMGLTAKQIAVNWFAASAPTSAHYVLEAGTVYKMVSERDTAWHAGNFWYNQRAIGIECRTECTEADISTLIDLIVDIYKRHGVLKIVGHKKIVSTDCPGLYEGRLLELEKRALERYKGQGQSGVWKQNKYGWWYEYAGGSYPMNTWKLIDDKWYHFNSEGYMQTGWIFLAPYWYYLSDKGDMKRGWLKDKDKWYYLDDKGRMLSTTWAYIDNYWYFFNEKGDMRTGWSKYKDDWYYLDEKNGNMLSDSYKVVDGKLYRFKEDGSLETKAKYMTADNGEIVQI